MTASGVRKSWETDWRSDVLRASPWRAISAALASSAIRSRASAWPTWSAAAAISRVCAVGLAEPRSRSAQTEPRASPLASIRTR